NVGHVDFFNDQKKLCIQWIDWVPGHMISNRAHDVPGSSTMKKWHLFAGLLAIGATLTLPAGEAEAARRTSLAGNRLILDRTDILTFPQLSVDYANMLSLDYGPTQG